MPELQLKRMGETLAVVFGEHHATVPWSAVAPNEQMGQHIYEAADQYGHTLFEQVMRDEGLRSALSALSTNERLVLVTDDLEVAALPWEYLRDANNMLLASRLNMVRYVPPARPRAPFDLTQALTVVAVPVSPVDEPRVLNTEREWQRLVEAVQAPRKALTLARVRPPTLAQMEQTLPGEGITIVHFMGHSGTVRGNSVLVFEDQRACSQLIDSAYFTSALDEQVFLVVLNSCLSAVIASTAFGNIAQALVRQGVPYALGMQFVLLDDAALSMSNTLYRHLLQGRSVEEAVRRARRALEQNTALHRPFWVAGIPALYTHMREPASAIKLETGQATISPDPERLQATCDLTALPQAHHFVGRSKEISEALELLLAPAARGFVLLHGLGGIGKTALAHAIAERVSWYYSDRVLAVSFETFATLESENQFVISETFADRFYNRLARYYGLDPKEYSTTQELQQAILQKRKHLRSLLVLDNMETLIDVQKRGDATARAVAGFISRLKEGDGTILLTSRSVPPADWGECKIIPLSGLSDEAGADLFLALLSLDRQSAAPREARLALAQRVQGHPLCIRLLAGRFDEVSPHTDLTTFLHTIEDELTVAEQTTPSSLEDPERQRTLYACMDYSVKRLAPEEQQVLHACSIFLASFPSVFAEMLLGGIEQTSRVLQTLARLSLLERKTRTFPEGTLELLEMHPMLRWYLQHHLPPLGTDIQRRYGLVYQQFVRVVYDDYDQSALIRYLVLQSLPDCEAALDYLPPPAQSVLAYHLAFSYKQMGQNRRAQKLYEQALEIDQDLGDERGMVVVQCALADVLKHLGHPREALAFYEQSLPAFQKWEEEHQIAIVQQAMANVLRQLGKPQEALKLYEQALAFLQKLGDERGIAVTERSMAEILVETGYPKQALSLYEHALHTTQALNDRRGTASVQLGMANALRQLGKPQEALKLYEQAFLTFQELSSMRDVAITQQAMAETLWRLGQLQEALDYYEQALQTAKALDDVRQVAVTQQTMANLLIHLGRLQEAVALCDQTLCIVEDLGDERGVALTLHCKANALANLGHLQDALALYSKALGTLQSLSDVRQAVVTLQAMADVLNKLDKPREALSLYEQAIQAFQQLGDIHGLSVTQVNLSHFLFRQGEHHRSLSLAWEAYSNLSQQGFSYDAQLAQSWLISIKGQFLDPVQFDALWIQAIGEPQPGWLCDT